MIRKRTRIFGLISIFIYSTILYLGLFFLVFIIIDMSKDNDKEVTLMHAFFYGLAIIGFILIALLVIFISIYVIISVKNYRKLNKNKISYNFFFANLIVSIIFFLNIAKSTIFPVFGQISGGGKLNILLLLGSLFALSGPITGIFYSLFAMSDYKRSVNKQL